MRTYGRTAEGQWVEITDVNYIWLATLAQTLRLNEKESPFYANYGIPARDAVRTQVAPTIAVSRTQSQYSQYFANLSVTKDQFAADPTYNISAIFLNGTVIQQQVAS
jgi:hypothetical protein